MKANAIKFNGQASPIAMEAASIYEYVKDQVEASRTELTKLEEEVNEQMNGKPKKKKKTGESKKPGGSGSGNMARIGGVAVNLGDLPQGMQFDGMDSDSGDEDDSYSGLLDP
jgi:hypothetical protein